VSKLAALAAARKKKDSEKSTLPQKQDESSTTPSREQKPSSLSLLERLSVNNGKETRTNDKSGGLSALSKENRLGSRVSRTKNALGVEKSEPKDPDSTTAPLSEKGPAASRRIQETEAAVSLRASPSTFARIVVGDGNDISSSEPSHLVGTSFDVLEVYGQDHTEAFDFTGPSPDDVVLNAQSASKGLPIRGMI
jgi:elongation factor 1 alpha-like protein